MRDSAPTNDDGGPMSELRYEVEDPVALITLERPDKLTALS